MASTSIVIPVYNNWQGCHQLLLDLYKNCSLIEEVIIVDDASPDPAVQMGLAWWVSQKLLPIEIITNDDNLGFLKSSNIGMKFAVEDIVCLISTDVRVHKDIVSFAKDKLNTEIWNGHNFYSASFMGARYIDWDTGWNKFGDTLFPYLEGWILCGYKKDWKMIDYFDERFAPNDYEDIDFSTKCRLWDWDLMKFPDGYVTHVGAQSIGYTDERQSLTEKNKKKFEEKWIKNEDRV